MIHCFAKNNHEKNKKRLRKKLIIGGIMSKASTKPYQERQTVPLYFYPFLSTLSSVADHNITREFERYLQEDKMQERETLLYIHIPYCKNICHFCGYYHDVLNERSDILDRYVNKLILEINQYANYNYVKKTKISAVYFGGGTPSVLRPEQIEKLFSAIVNNFMILPSTEISFEGEVRTLKDIDRLKVLKDFNCTRLSFGVQSFDPQVRRLAGIFATENDVRECIENIKTFGYELNIDLMYGLPGQSDKKWENDIDTAIDMKVCNLDLYDTVIYPQAFLFKKRNEYKDIMADEMERLEMLSTAIEKLESKGYRQETIEDFTIPGKEYKMKRLVYGGGDGRSQIIALGAGAVGVLNNSSYRNFPPKEYLEWDINERPLPHQLHCTLSKEEYFKRALVFFPKLLKLNKKTVNNEWLKKYSDILDGMSKRGLIVETDNEIELTKTGRLWTDSMAMEFIGSAKEAQKIWKIGS